MMIINQCKDKVPAELASHELLLSVRYHVEVRRQHRTLMHNFIMTIHTTWAKPGKSPASRVLSVLFFPLLAIMDMTLCHIR